MPTLAAWEHQSSHGGEDFGIQLGSSSIYLTSSLESSVSVSTYCIFNAPYCNGQPQAQHLAQTKFERWSLVGFDSHFRG